MRVAVLNAGHMDYGGTERVVAYQARELNARRYSVSIFTPVNNKRIFSDVIPKEVSLKSWWHTLPTPVLKRTINRLLHFWLGGKELTLFDLLIAHNQPAPYVAFKNKKKNGRPYIVYCHAPWRRLYPREVDLVSGWASDYREKIMFLRQDYWRRIDLESIRGANVVLVNSMKIKMEVKQVYGVTAKLCYPGIDVSKFANCSREYRKSVKEKYCIDEHTLLIVGRHAPQKRLEWIPELIKMLNRKMADVKVLVTGMPNSLVTPKLIAEARRFRVEDKVKIIGVVPEDELIALYHSCPVLVYTAVNEDFGLPPIEAMACGCVPVAWNEGAGPCETIVNETTGLLAKPYDLNDFAEKVMYLLANPSTRVSMAHEGKASVVKYDWSNHITILEQTIHQVMG
jgi:glycosyltransferase involved in cell wall biosynthesis